MGLSKILQYGFLTFLFLLPFQTVFLLREPFIHGEKWQYGTIGVYVTDILFGVLLGCLLAGWAMGRYTGFRASNMKHHTSIILFIFWVGISMFWARDTLLAYSFFITVLLAGNVFLWARLLDQSMIRKTVFVLMLGAVLQSGIGIAQFLSQQSWDSTLLGMSIHEFWQAGSSVLKIDGERFLRAYGTFPHPNMLGGFLVVVLILGLGYGVALLQNTKEPSKVSHPILRILYLSSLIIILLGLILTFSRTAWLGAIVGIATLFIWSFLSSDTRKLRSSFSCLPIKILEVLVCAGIVFVGVLHAQIFPRFDGVTIEREGSVSERLQSLRDAGIVIGEGNILLGTGIGNFTAEVMRLQPGRPVWSIQPAHNVFVLVLAELGLVGCIFFGAFLWNVFRNIKKKNVIFAIALLVLLPSLFLDHWLWTSHFGIFFFFLLLGLSQSKDRCNIN